MPIVMALDIATTTGMAFDGPGGRPLFATYRAPDALDADDYGSRYAGFERWVHDTMQLVKPEILAFEAPLMPRGNNMVTNVRTVRLLMGLAAVAELVAVRAGIEAVEKNVATVKKHFAGTGHAKKPDMMARARLLGWNIKNDHEADAGALWSLVKAEVDPTFGYHAGHQTTPLLGRAGA